jgi:hypothetical protein
MALAISDISMSTLIRLAESAGAVDRGQFLQDVAAAFAGYCGAPANFTASRPQRRADFSSRCHFGKSPRSAAHRAPTSEWINTVATSFEQEA